MIRKYLVPFNEEILESGCAVLRFLLVAQARIPDVPNPALRFPGVLRARVVVWMVLWISLGLVAGSSCGPDPAPDPARSSSPTASRSHSQTGARPPNLVLVLADTLRAASLPLYGYPEPTAPFLSELAADSLVFDHHLSHYPATPFSVSQMFTGRLMSPLLMGYDFRRAPVRAVEDDLLLLPRVLGEMGYTTTLISTHPWFNRSARLLDYFDDVRLHGGGDSFAAYAPFAEMLPDVTEVLEAGAAGGRPFFLYLHTLDPHMPRRMHPELDPPAEGEGAGEPDAYALYDSEIRYTDHWLGQVAARLRALDLWERTVFVFTSDHGEDLGELGPEWWNDEHGATVRRSLLHVPLVIRAPHRPELRGRRSDLTRHVDLAPTLLRLLLPELELDRFRLDGHDLFGSEAPEVTESVSFSRRYWGLHRRDTETYYDPWEDRAETVRLAPDERNYPRPVPVDGAEPGAASDEGERLRRIRRARLREFERLPHSYEKLGGIYLGLPQGVVSVEGLPPTYVLDRFDTRWSFGFQNRLWCGIGERLGRITLATPWAPGRYRVAVKIGLGAGTVHAFKLRFAGSGNTAIAVDSANGDDEGWVDVGEQILGDPLKLEIWDPSSGLSLSALHVELVEATAPGALPTDEPAEDGEEDEELEERLRALGYVG